MVAQTRKGGNSPRKLKFHDKLVGKGLSTDALLKKLKALHTELADLDQENVDLKSLNPVCKELISTSVLLHKDKGVKAYAACCLADLLRVYAPDAPYTGTELRDIFQFFFRQLSTGLKSSDSPYYNEYFHLLESLSTVKSVVLVCDLPQADELMVQIFRDFFGLVRNDLAKNIEMFMGDILVALIDECQTLPTEVLESVMAQFMDKNTHMDQPAYRMAVEVCNATSDKLQRHVCQYFTDNIVQHSQADNFDEVRTAHELIKRLNHSCPSLLHNVVPQLEEELRVEEVQLRQMATQVLGEMFADKGGELVKKYASTWNLWLARMNDKSPLVRLSFVEACKGLLLHHQPELRESVEKAMESKLCDPDEKVRAAVCKMYSQLDYETSLHYVGEKQLRAVGGRSMDKKQSVRQESLSTIGKLYSVAYSEIENNDSAAIKQFAWIPQQVLHAITATLEVKAFAEQVIAEYILPLPVKGDDEVAWTDRLLTTMKYLDEKAINILISVSGIKNTPTLFERYAQCCVENNGGIIDEDEENVKRKLAAIIKFIATQFQDPQQASEDLQKFAKTNEQRLYKLLKTCMDPHTDLKGMVKATNEFTRRVEESSLTILPTMSSFIRQASLRIINQSSIPTLVKRVQKGDPTGTGHGSSQAQISANHAQFLLTTISKHCPAIFKPHISEFGKAIADEKNSRLVEVCLQALAAVSRWDAGLAPSDKRTIDRVMRYVHESNHRHAKFSARILAYTKKRDELCMEVVESITENLQNADSDLLVAHIAVLAELAQAAPDAFEQRSDVIMAFLLKETLMAPCVLDADSMDTDDAGDVEWAEIDSLPPLTRAKILSLKVCRRRCLAHAQSDSASDIANPALKMFFTLLENGGSINEDDEDDPRVKSRVRLQAAWSLVQLATVEKFCDAIVPNFVLLAVTVQDSCFNVRMGFLAKLIGLLHARRLRPCFNLIPFLTVHDPEDEVKEKARNYVTFAFKRAAQGVKYSHFEHIFIRLIHLLAHHPDFGITESQLQETAKYINMYLDLIASIDNLPLLYHIAMKVKTVRDAESHTYSENLYVTSELAQELIKKRAKTQGWSLTSFPGKIKLPSDIFRAHPNPETANKILKTVYLPERTMQSLDAITKATSKPRAERKIATKRKAAEGKAIGSAKRSRAAAKRRKYDDENNDEEEDEDEDDGDRSSAASVTRNRPSTLPSEEPADEMSDNEAVEQLGRGARTRAKAKARRQAGRKPKSNGHPSDD